MWIRTVLLVGLLAFATHVMSQQNPSSSAVPGDSQSQSPASRALTSDDLLRQKVQEQLNADSALNDVHAEALNGAVRLTGRVASRADQSRALDLARSVPGVRSVKEYIQVAKDAGAAQANQRAVTGHTAINETNQNAAGSVAGNAGLAGTSPATGQAATQNAGVNDGVSTAEENSPQAIPVPDGSNNQALRQQIESALQDDPTLAGTRIAVNVSDSNIELSGLVPTPREKETAYRIAQSYGNNRRVDAGGLNVQSRTVGAGNAQQNQ